jgi:DUF438 domain-containing protein
MWGIHDEIRAGLRSLAEWLGSGAPADPAELDHRFNQVAGQIRDMVYKEEKILFPAALGHLKEADWLAIHNQEDEIGHFLVAPGRQWSANAAAAAATATVNPIDRIHGRVPPAVPALQPAAAAASSGAALPLNTGALTLEQVDLMLRNLPVDVTFVDEKDEVRYFSQTRERIFSRTPAIIGRKVQNCHPPHSVYRVQQILDDFRAGVSDTAEFWIQMGGKMIHIRYFALRDAAGAFRGTLEVSQDVTGIRALEGERRLLDGA